MTAVKSPRQKIGNIDRRAITRTMEIAAIAVDPDEYTYRSVFRDTMPKLYVMRARGLSFRQIHWMLQQSGFPIALTTLRTYYYEYLPGMMAECQKYLKKSHKIIADADKAAAVTDRTPQRQATVLATRAAMTADIDTRAASQINAITAIRGSAAGTPMAPDTAASPANAGPATPTPALAPFPSVGSGNPMHPAVPSPAASTRAFARGLHQPALDAPGSAATASPTRGGTAATTSSQQLPAAGAPGGLRCTTEPLESQIEIGEGLPAEVFSDAVLEHPAIPALMLTRAQRLFIGRLEYRNAAGSPCLEKGTEMMNRREWTPAVPPSVGRTSGDFVELDTTIIGRRKTR
jgi:hypothetical protein